MAIQQRVNVVTVGAGWTAAILAWKLTAAGLDVVSLEQGPERWANPSFEHNHDALRHLIRKALMVDLATETWTWRPNPRLPALPIRQFGAFHPGQGLGGSGIHWAAETWRYYPTDFAFRSHHIERYGEGKLPEGSTIRDWPISYDELEPYYDQVDYDIGVSGQAGNLNGVILDGGNPFEGPRQRPYPLPPLASSIPATMFADATRALGYHPFPQPASILSRAYTGLSGRPRSGCLYCGFCTRYGCEVDAKASPITDHIPLALDTGRYQIRYQSKVLGIETGADGLATGLRYIDQATGEEHVQPADIVILSGFTLSNVRLLLLSRSEAHADGVGNARGMVGKNFTYQLQQSPVTGVFEGARFNLFMGNNCLATAIHDFNADNFDHRDLDFIGGASIRGGMAEMDPLTSTLDLPVKQAEAAGASRNESSGGSPNPAIAGELGSLAGSGVEWGQGWKENLRQNWMGSVTVETQGESLPYEDQFLDLDPVYTDAYGLPLLRLTFDFHESDRRLYRFLAARCDEIMRAMNPSRVATTAELADFNIYSYQSTHTNGGAIMGSDPSNSVTNKYGQVWDTPNLFVTGAALWPQNPGMNPTGTVLAVAYMAGDAIVNTYINDPNRIMG